MDFYIVRVWKKGKMKETKVDLEFYRSFSNAEKRLAEIKEMPEWHGILVTTHFSD